MNFIHDIAKDEYDKKNEMHNINNTKKNYKTQSQFNDLQREKRPITISEKGGIRPRLSQARKDNSFK